MKLSDFTKVNSCTNRSADVVVTKTATSRHLDEAIIAKDFCKDIISGEYTVGKLDELIDEVAASYSDSTIDDIEETQASYVKKLASCIWRYGRSEHRKTSPRKRTIVIPEKPIAIDVTSMIEVDFEGAEQIDCRIDAIDNYSEKNILEGIIYKKGLPKLGKTSAAYHNVDNEIPLHLMRLALRKYADSFLKVGEKVTIIASYYYMSKTIDRSDSKYIDDYFGESCPIRSLSETYERLPEGAKYGSDEHPYSKLDEELISLLAKWATGYEKCDLDEEKDCKACKDYYICHYEVAPKRLSEEKTVKKREKHTLTDEQEIIVNAQEGIFICNAVPGSGKTETAIKQRTISIIEKELDELIKRYESGEDVTIDVKASYLTMDSRS